MNAALILNLVLTHGPSIIELIAKLRALQKEGGTVTDADFADLQRLASRTSADYLREAQKGT